MLFLFSRNKKIGSKIIRWGLDEPVSHFAMVFDERPGGYGLLFHAHFSGVSLQWFGDWFKENEIVYAFTPKEYCPVLEEERIYQVFVRRFYGKDYDSAAMAYWCRCIIMHRLFGTAIPKKNAWGEKNKFLCYEIAEGFEEIAFLGLPKITSEEMTTPYKLKCALDYSPFLMEVSHLYRG